MLVGLEATAVGIGLILEFGIDVIERRVRELTASCIEGLLTRGLRVHTSTDWECRAGCIALPVVRGPDIVSFMRQRKIDLWTDYTGTILRIDPHVFNNLDDVEACLQGLDDFRMSHQLQSD